VTVNTLVTTAGLTAIPALAAARHPVADSLQSAPT
jgi:hypothetical protein